jgi:glycosyltransferase involved in cell wall biosynthesis
VYGDAISNHALAIKGRLLDLGYRSQIFVRYLDERIANKGKLFEPGCITGEAGLFYHHSIGSELTEHALVHAGPKCLIYHNITPAEFFEEYRPEFARILAEGRTDLSLLSSYFSISVGDSTYNCSELEENGFNDPMVMPIVVDPDRWNIVADQDLMRRLQDGKANLLFVGRIAPNKKQDQLVEAFARYLAMDRDARLILVGYAEAGDAYQSFLVETVERLGLTDHVVLAGAVSEDQLFAYYRTAHLFWSMSEHEGFCAPIVEAMWFDIPVLAFKSTAIPETLGEAAIMFTRKNDFPSIAALARHLVRDSSLRAKVVKAQRKRRADFLPRVVWEKLDVVLDQMERRSVETRPMVKRTVPAKKVAFVVQRCGLEVNGGAEALCLKMARRMSAYWEAEILTTCALDYMTWENHYAAGIEDCEGVRMRRFRVDRSRDIHQFDKLSGMLQGRIKQAPAREQEQWMLAQGPVSSDLIEYVKQHKDDYDAFIFFSYLYATTYLILPLVEEKAYLVPLAHDEWPIQMSMWDLFFQRPRGVVFNTPEERAFLRSRFPAIALEGPVAGVAVESSEDYSAERFRQRYGLRDPFLLYIGRIDPSKGCDELLSHFAKYREHNTGPRKLVLLGKTTMPILDHPDVIGLGFVDEQTKWDALAACDLLVNPSPYESLSMVLLESWSINRAVLVNGLCEVLVGQCKRANGGLWYKSYDEFEACLSLLLDSTELRRRLGESGQRYAANAYSWERIEEIYLELISQAKNL